MDTNTESVLARRNCLALPYVATTEAKAEMFADAIEALFTPCVETEVFEDGGGWGVAVVKGMDGIDDPLNNERIISAFILVSSFDLTERHGDIDCVAQLLTDIPPLHKAMTKRARRAFRIEDKLDAILAHLGHTPATDAHTLPAPKPSPASKDKATGKKPSGKEKKAGATA